MIEAVVFDLEGTIVNVEEIHFSAFLQIARNLGLHLTFEKFLEEIPNAIGGGDRWNAEGIRRLSGDKASVESIVQLKREIYEELLEGYTDIPPRPGFLEVFTEIRRSGLPVAVASSTPRKQADFLLERSGIGKLFPENLILLEDFGGKLKPYPNIYLETARRMGIHPSEQLVFEDSATGLKAARAAGSPAIAMPIYIFQENIDKLKAAGAFKIFYSWKDVDIASFLEELADV